MASVGSLSASTSNGLYGASVHGFTGLASGMDTDSLIEGMTYGTRSKIAKQLQSKQKLQWQQNAYRSVSSKLIDFQQKYLSMTAKGSLFRAGTFSKSLVELNGVNSHYLDVTGASDMLEKMSVLGVKQMAKDASLVTQVNASQQSLKTGEIDLGETFTTAYLEGQNLQINYGGTTYSVKLTAGEDGDLTTRAGIAEAFNKAVEGIEVTGGKLSDKVQMQVNGGQFELVDVGAGGNTLKLMGGSDRALELMGFGDADSFGTDGKKIEGALTGSSTLAESDLSKTETFAEHVGGKTIRFSLNGSTKSITLPAQEDINSVEDLKNALQNSLNSAFGSNKVEVGVEDGALTFKTRDNSSVFKVVSADAGLTGTGGALKMSAGMSNRISLGVGLEKSGLASAGELDDYIDPATGELKLSINGVAITGLTKDSTVTDIMSAINNSSAGVTVKYLETADKFSITSNVHGSAGKIEFDGGDNFAQKLFGSGTVAEGKDAIVTVEYEGGVQMDITRDSNTFNLEGATLTVKGEFGFIKTDAAGNSITDPADYIHDSSVEAVTFTTSVDTESIAKTVSEMIDAYNEIIKEAYGQTGTRPDRGYQPLTDEQKKDMSESEIKTWEEKAQAGILFNDSLLTGLENDMRFVFSGVADVGTLENMGITISDDYTEHGKVSFDSDKFQAALAADPNKIKDMFTKSASGTDKGGFMARMNSVYNTYAKTVGAYKGSLIERAGSPASALSLLNNTIQKQMDEIGGKVNELKKYLQTEIDRYNSQFTQLERLISQMNSQSSMLSGLGA